MRDNERISQSLNHQGLKELDICGEDGMELEVPLALLQAAPALRKLPIRDLTMQGIELWATITKGTPLLPTLPGKNCKVICSTG